MSITRTIIQSISAWCVGLAITVSPAMILAQTDHLVPPAPSFNTNPTDRLIIPRKGQTVEQQQADQLACYLWVCDQVDWDPYQAYDALVAEGYAVALSEQDKMQGLICLAAHGAVTGAIAGELLDRPEAGPGEEPPDDPQYDDEDAAEIGTAIALAGGLIRSAYLNDIDDPVAQRILRRFESNLRKWDRKYSACLSRKGYRIPSP